jgi:restriction system protein
LDWKNYQEEAAEFFRTLGLDAKTDITVQGVRTKHDIDVLVKSKHAGFEITWIVECKHWKAKVSKLHVLVLREIVHDTGADRGILLAENGYQSGAIEAASLTNVHVTSLAEVTKTASHEVLSFQLRELFDRLMICKYEYWELPKELRIKSGLRTDVEIGYSGDWATKIAEDIITKGFRGEFPIKPEIMYINVSHHLANQIIPEQISTLKELVEISTRMIVTLETKIDICKKMSNESA